MEVKNEEDEAPLLQPSNVAAPKPRTPTPDHPPYAEMVRAALRELAEEGGSTEASISGYMQSNYTQLPTGHSKLLSYYIGKFVAAGEVSMLTPDRFALPRTPPSLPPTPPPHHSPTPNPTPNPSPRRLSSCPHLPRRRGRPPKRKRTTASGSAVGLKLPPWPRSPHHVTDANAPPRRGRGRPRKNPENVVHSEVKAPSATKPVSRPRLIIRLESKPSNPMPDSFSGHDVSGMNMKCDSRNVDGLETDEKSFPANARKREESPPLASSFPAALELELKEALMPPASAAWQQAELGEEPMPPAPLLPATDETSLPLVSLHSEPEVEMLLLDQMQPEPEGALLLLQPEPELLPPAPKQPKSNEEQSLLTPLHPETEGKQYMYLPAAMWSESKKSPMPAAQLDAESVVLPASAQLDPDGEPLLPPPFQPPMPTEEPLAPGLLQFDAKELKEDCLSSSTTPPEFDESYFPLLSLHPEPCKELLLLDAMQPKLEEEFLQLLPLQSDTEFELLPLPASMHPELHEEPILSISAQPEPVEQPALQAPLSIKLKETSPHLAPEQPEPIEQTKEGSFQTARLLSDPRDDPLLLPAMLMEPREELLPLAIEPEGTEESSPPAPLLAVEKGEKSGHSSKHRRTHAKHRRLWFEC